MPKTPNIVVVEESRPAADACMERLGIVVRTMELMQDEERAAAFVYLKMRFRSQWPHSSDY